MAGDVPFAHIFPQAFSQIDPDVGLGEIVFHARTEAAQAAGGVPRRHLPHDMPGGGHVQFGVFQGIHVFSGTEAETPAVGGKGQPWRRPFRAGRGHPERFGVILEAQAQPFLIPEA